MEESNQENAQPLSVKDWVITLIIASIPIVQIIMLFVWGFGSNTNLNKANWSKAVLILLAIAIGLFLLFSLILGALGAGMFSVM